MVDMSTTVLFSASGPSKHPDSQWIMLEWRKSCFAKNICWSSVQCIGANWTSGRAVNHTRLEETLLLQKYLLKFSSVYRGKMNVRTHSESCQIGEDTASDPPSRSRGVARTGACGPGPRTDTSCSTRSRQTHCPPWETERRSCGALVVSQPHPWNSLRMKANSNSKQPFIL